MQLSTIKQLLISEKFKCKFKKIHDLELIQCSILSMIKENTSLVQKCPQSLHGLMLQNTIFKTLGQDPVKTGSLNRLQAWLYYWQLNYPASTTALLPNSLPSPESELTSRCFFMKEWFNRLGCLSSQRLCVPWGYTQSGLSGSSQNFF